jgi:hypothetical protein
MKESCPATSHQFKPTIRGFSIKGSMGKQRYVKTRLGSFKAFELVLDTLMVCRFDLSIKCDLPVAMLPPV